MCSIQLEIKILNLKRVIINQSTPKDLFLIVELKHIDLGIAFLLGETCKGDDKLYKSLNMNGALVQFLRS